MGFCSTPFHTVLYQDGRGGHLQRAGQKKQRSLPQGGELEILSGFNQIIIAAGRVRLARVTVQFLFLVSLDVTVYCAMP